MESIENNLDLNQKKVILRLDLNVPLSDGIITDTTRIDKIIPTINYLLKKNSKIIILSHIGRPKGKIVNKLSLRPVCDEIKKKINVDVKLITKSIRDILPSDLFENSEEKVLMLENIRFYKEEENGDENFGKHISCFGDLYVNDAFSCSHRAHSSINQIPKFIPAYSGLQLNTEINALKKITTEIERPITCVIGGSKISSKINVIKNLVNKLDNLIIVGGMANNILEYKGFEIGNSIKEQNCKKIIEEIFNLSKKKNCKIFYPEDVVVAKKLNGSPKTKLLKDVKSNEMILDVGNKTIEKIKNVIKTSNTVFWNGPAGYFENSDFANGSYKIGKEIAKETKNKKIFSVIGGGDTISVIKKINLFDEFNFVSTAGGAFLEYLEGKVLPGIKALN